MSTHTGRHDDHDQSQSPDVPGAAPAPLFSGAGGTWEGWVNLGPDPLTGKRRRRKVRARTEGEVHDRVARMIATANDATTSNVEKDSES